MRNTVKLTTSLTVALAAAVLAAPAALANLGVGGPPGAPWGKPIGLGGPSPARLTGESPLRLTGDSGGQLPRYSIQPAAEVQAPSATGFDWGDAGIGGGFASGVLLLGGGLTLVMRRRHDRPATA